MGGLLLSTKRISKQKYQQLVEGLEEDYLLPLIGKENYFIPRSILDKSDFGDVDVNVKSTVCTPNWNQYIKNTILKIPHTEYKQFNAGVSLNHQDFSVDFFCRHHSTMGFAYYFLSDNCAGNIIGKIAKRMELKFGEDGLSWVFRRNEGSYVKDFLISNDFEKVCGFLGLDYDRWHEGFTYEQLFSWITNSKYFTTDPFLDPSGHLKKRLQQERPTILKFVEYLQSNNIHHKNTFDATATIGMVDDYFGCGLAEKIAKEKEREKIIVEIHSKYNGHLLMEWLGISGKELGKTMNDYSNSFPSQEAFESFILLSAPTTIKENIKNFYTNAELDN